MPRPMLGPLRGRDRICSNFHPSPIRIEGEEYPTTWAFFHRRPIQAPDVERACQSAKSDDPATQDRILRARTAGEAKRMGRRTRMHVNPFREGYRRSVIDAKGGRGAYRSTSCRIRPPSPEADEASTQPCAQS